MNLHVGDIVRQRGAPEGDLLRVTALYDGCDEVVVEEYPDPFGCFDALRFDLVLVERPPP